MTSSKTLKKIVSIGAALMLAVGGSLVAAQPAQATGPQPEISAVNGTPFAGNTISMAIDFPDTYTSNNVTYDLKPANFNNQNNTLGDAYTTISGCNWMAPLPSTVEEITVGFGGGSCTDPAGASPQITASSGTTSLSLTLNYTMPNGPYDIGASYQIGAVAQYIDSGTNSVIGVRIVRLFTVLAEITGTSATNVTSSSATVNFSSDYNNNNLSSRPLVAFIVRAANAAVSTVSDIEAVVSTNGHTQLTSYSGPSAINLNSGLNSSTAYAVDFLLLNITNNTKAVTPVYTVTFTTPAPPATTPGVIQNPSATAGNGQVALTWTAPVSDGGATITGYVIEYDTNPFGFGQSTTSNTTSKTITGLTNGTNYFFRIKATNSVGSGLTTSVPNYYTPTAPVVAPSTYSLTFDLQGGSIVGTPTTFSNLYQTGNVVNLGQRLTAYSPSRSGYTFNGWFLNQSGGSSVTSVTFANSDITVYAQWTAQQQQNNNSSMYTVTFDPNGGTVGQMSSAQASAGAMLLPGGGSPYMPSRSGYSFNGWGTSQGSTTVVSSINVSGPVTVFAVWTATSSSCPGQTGLTNVTLSTSNILRTGTYKRIYNNEPTLNGCSLPQMALSQGTFVNGVLLGSITSYLSVGLPASTADRTLSGIEAQLGRQLVAGDVITFKYWSGTSNSIQAASLSPTFAPTLTIIGATVTTTDSTDVVDVAPITEDMRPLPTWASNIVSSIPTLTKSLVTTGGSVALTGGDFTDLKSVTIGGKAVEFKIETTGNVNIPVPAGEAGKTADLLVVFGGGKMLVHEAIKYVAQVDVAKVTERPIAIAAGAKKITAAVADQIRQAAFANPKNTHIQCVAYAANSSAKAQAAAKLTAVQACGVAAKANPALKISEVSVIVNKAKARQSAVGIKVYKQN